MRAIYLLAWWKYSWKLWTCCFSCAYKKEYKKLRPIIIGRRLSPLPPNASYFRYKHILFAITCDLRLNYSQKDFILLLKGPFIINFRAEISPSPALFDIVSWLLFILYCYIILKKLIGQYFYLDIFKKITSQHASLFCFIDLFFSLHMPKFLFRLYL